MIDADFGDRLMTCHCARSLASSTATVRSPCVAAALLLLVSMVAVVGLAAGQTAPDELDQLRRLAESREAAGDLVAASDAVGDLIELQRRRFGEGRLVFDALGWLARLAFEMGDSPRAESLLKEAVEIPRLALGDDHPDYAEGLVALGSFYFVTQDYDQALSRFSAALAIQEVALGVAHPDYAGALMAVGRVHLARQEYDQAERRFRTSLEVRRRALGDDHPDVGVSLNALAAVYLAVEAHLQAEPLLQRAAEIVGAAKGREHPEYATVLANRAMALAGLGRADEAAALVREALDLRRQILGSLHPDTVTLIDRLALLYERAGELSAAEPLFSEVVQIRIVRGEHATAAYASSLVNLAVVRSGLGRFADAEQLYVEALDIQRRELGDSSPEYATNLGRLGVVYLDSGQPDRAEPLLRSALAIHAAVLDHADPAYATSLNNLAGFFHATGDYAQAEPLLRAALDIMQATTGESDPDYALGLYNLTWLYVEMGDTARVEPLLRQAIGVQRAARGDDDPVYATMLNGLGLFYLQTGQYDRARAALDAALASRRRLGETNPRYLETLSNLAGVHLYEGDYPRARQLFGEARAGFERTLGAAHPYAATALYNLARTEHFAGDFDRALPLYERTLRLRGETRGESHPAYAGALADLAELHALRGDATTAATLSRQAVRAIRSHGQRTAAALSERQQLAEVSGARRYLDSYLSLTATGGASADEAYGELLAWKGAFHVRQRRTRTLRRAATEDSGLSTTFAELEDATRALGTLTMAGASVEAAQQTTRATRMAALIDRIEELERALAGRSDRVRRELAPATPDAIREALPERSALVDVIDYSFLAALDDPYSAPMDRVGRTAAFVVRPGRPVVRIELGATDRLAATVEAWLATEGGEAAIGARLRRMLWEPLAEAVGDVDTVLVAPDGALGRLPWGALPGREPGSFLVEDMAFAVVPVPQLLPGLLGVARASPAPSLLTLGDVDYDAEPGRADAGGREAARAGALGGWDPLGNTGLEIEGIAADFAERYPQAPVTSLSGADATESAVRDALTSHRWAHLATHGFFADGDLRSALDRSGQVLESSGVSSTGFGERRVTGWHPGLLSGLVLAGANREGSTVGTDDGILTATEVAALDLSALELAALSACETGLGRSAGGEGMLGLQRAFQVAGAQTVVAGLWQVDDRATRVLMESMYQNLWVKGLSRVEALRQAQLALLRSSNPADRAPYFWAAFVLSGEWR